MCGTCWPVQRGSRHLTSRRACAAPSAAGQGWAFRRCDGCRRLQVRTADSFPLLAFAPAWMDCGISAGVPSGWVPQGHGQEHHGRAWDHLPEGLGSSLPLGWPGNRSRCSGPCLPGQGQLRHACQQSFRSPPCGQLLGREQTPPGARDRVAGPVKTPFRQACVGRWPSLESALSQVGPKPLSPRKPLRTTAGPVLKSSLIPQTQRRKAEWGPGSW